MKYMIHACPQRMWYVGEYLVPSMTAQGIDKENIIVWNDTEGVGNLASCLASFSSCTEDGETWHLQDDVALCHDFATRTASAPKGVVCGFCVRRYEDNVVIGDTIAEHMWQSSFPCIKIPNAIAVEFVRWIDAEKHRLQEHIQTGKRDDLLFHKFMLEKHGFMEVCNMAPHLVEHVDWLIGGSVINNYRGFIPRGMFWEDETIIEELKTKLAGH